jgi:hypothetical protein
MIGRWWAVRGSLRSGKMEASVAKQWFVSLVRAKVPEHQMIATHRWRITSTPLVVIRRCALDIGSGVRLRSTEGRCDELETLRPLPKCKMRFSEDNSVPATI